MRIAPGEGIALLLAAGSRSRPDPITTAIATAPGRSDGRPGMEGPSWRSRAA